MRRVAALLISLLAVSCNDGDNGPTSPSCMNLAGNWAGTYGNSCGGSETGQAVVSQSSCTVTVVALAISARGTINGNTLTFSASDVRCPGTVFNGTATIHSASSITGSYSTASSTSCCPQGSFTLIR